MEAWSGCCRCRRGGTGTEGPRKGHWGPRKGLGKSDRSLTRTRGNRAPFSSSGPDRTDVTGAFPTFQYWPSCSIFRFEPSPPSAPSRLLRTRRFRVAVPSPDRGSTRGTSKPPSRHQSRARTWTWTWPPMLRRLRQLRHPPHRRLLAVQAPSSSPSPGGATGPPSLASSAGRARSAATATSPAQAA